MISRYGGRGAAGGAVGGFVGGALNAWVDGGNFEDGMEAGFKGAGMGALGGAALGGLMGGISAVAKHGNFWDGEGMILATADAPDLGVTAKDKSCFTNQDEVDICLNENGFSNGASKQGVHEYLYDRDVSPEMAAIGYRRTSDGIVINPKGEQCGGTSVAYVDHGKVLVDVYMSPHNTEANFNITLNHELIHAYHFNSLYDTNNISSPSWRNEVVRYSEWLAYSYTSGYHPVSVPRYYGSLPVDLPNYLINVPCP